MPFIVIAGSMLVSRSETDNVENYLKMDNNCLAYRSDFFFDLFPSWSDFVRVQNEYQQYHYFDYEDFIGHRSDIFAQIKLGKEDFENEIAIQKSNFDRYFENHAEDWICLNYEEFTHGGYNCIAFYTDAEPFDDFYENWHIYMFAYNTESRTVRYAYYDCSEYDDSFNSELPYFASLSW